MLVLGRPGAGCTSFLKVMSNDRDGFDHISGDVHYGSMDHKEAAKFRQQFMFNNEGSIPIYPETSEGENILIVHLRRLDDVHFPTLTVDQTIKFALRNKTPSIKPDSLSDKKFVKRMRDEILGSLGIIHTRKTLVGNEFVRGVSGGERKRVSLAEVMAGQVCPSHACETFSICRDLTADTSYRARSSAGTSQLVVLMPAPRLISPNISAALRTNRGRRFLLHFTRQGMPYTISSIR